MAVDQFGYELTEEERFLLMMEQQQMGLLPGLLGGPAVDTFSGIPSSLPAYGPAAGYGPSAYMGAPQRMPTYNQSPALAAPSMLVDNTQAGMATVPFTGMESSFSGDGTQVAAGPGWGFNISPDSVGVSWGVPKDLPTQDPTGGIIWPSQPTTDLPVSDIVKDIIPLPGIPEGPSQGEIDVETQIDTFSELDDPTGGLAATDPSLQGVTPTSMVQAGYRPGGGGPGNTDWQGNVREVLNKSQFDLGDFTMPSYTGFPRVAIPALATTLAPALGPALGLGLTAAAITAAIAGEGPQPGEPYSGMGDAPDPMFTGHPGMMGATGYDLSGAGMAQVPAEQTAKSSPETKWSELVDTFTPKTLEETFKPNAAAFLQQPILDQLKQVKNFYTGPTQAELDATAAANVDDFSAIPTTTVTPVTPRVSKAAQNKEKARMRELAKQQAADKHKANVAAAQAKHEENLRVAELTRQAVARQQQAAAQQAQIAREVQAAQDRVRQAKALMNSKAYNESGMGGLTAAERDIVAAAQVDTFAGMGAEGPMSAAEINVAGGMEFGGAGGMAGSDRGGGGRGGPGGRGR